jgi:hypothetical protein
MNLPVHRLTVLSGDIAHWSITDRTALRLDTRGLVAGGIGFGDGGC